MSEITNNLHINLKQIKKTGDNTVIDIVYPKNTTDDVELSNIENSSIPNNIDNMTGIINNLGSGAFSNKTTVDSSLSSTSTNPVQNKVIKTELDKKQQGPLVGSTSEITPAQVIEAVKANRDVIISIPSVTMPDGGTADNIILTTVNTANDAAVVMSMVWNSISFELYGDIINGWSKPETYYIAKSDDLNSKAELFIVTVTESNGKYTADKTLEEIEDALRSHKVMLCQYKYNVFVYKGMYMIGHVFEGSVKGTLYTILIVDDDDIVVSSTKLASTDVATTSANGLMSSTDKKKLDGIADGANNYTHPSSHPATMITENSTHRFVTDNEKSNWNAKASTAVASESANGLMSSTDKKKLDGIAEGANKTTVDSSLSSTSTNPVQNKVITNWLSENVKKYRFAKDNNDNVYLTTDEVSTTAAGPADGINGKYEAVYGVLAGSSEYKFGSFWNNIKEKPDTFTPSVHTHTKAEVGLGNVDNTADANKSVKSATTATKDSAGQQINTTYIKDVSISGKTVTITKGNGTKTTQTTQDTTYSDATQTANGLMSSTDKKKLDGIAEGANNYTHPTYTAKPTAKLYKTTIDGTGHVNSAAEVTKADITALGIPAQDTTYSTATQTANGLMSSTDKKKLDGIAEGANKTTVDSSLSSTSTNPVQNKVINTALSGKSNTGHKHTKSEITDFPTSMPASDVYNWAKASTKPSYTKAEVGLGNVDNTADINKPISTAVQTALTNLDTSLKKYADTKISNLIGGAAPETLDTITEIAEAITNNKSVIDALNDSVANKVDKVSGKGLSTNDFTNGYKSNVDANTTARHSHTNKTVLDAISSTKTGNWDSAYTHISDTTKHITANERTLWNTVSDKEPKITTKNTAFNKNFGTTAGTVCQGNDSRLSNARKANGGNSDTVGGKNPNTFAYLATASSTVDSVSSVDANTVGGYAPADLIKTTDVVNSLTSNETSKPLSANQGKALKALIDAKTVPSNLSAFNDDVGYLTSAHNTSSTAHSDIRTSLTTISNKMNLFFDTNNTAFDQLSELIAYMQLNRDKANSALEGLNNCISSSKLSDGYTEGDSTKVASNKAVTDVYNAIPKTVASLSDAGNYAKKNVSQTFSGTQTFATAKASASTAYTTAKFRNIVLSTAEPTSSNGNNGDVWIVYSA